MIPVCLLSIIWFAAIFFAGVHLWTRSVIILSVLVCVLAGLLQWLRGRKEGPGRSFSIICDPPSLAGICFLLLVAIQLLPIPPSLLRILSPQGSALWGTAGTLGGNVPSVLSLYPFMTANSLLFALCVLLFYWLSLYGLKNRKEIRMVVAGLLLLGLFESLYGLIQLVSADPHILWWRKMYGPEVASGTFINRNHLAGFLSMMTCLGVGYAWALGRQEKRGSPHRRTLFRLIERWGTTYGMEGTLLFLCIAIMIAGLLVSASRGGVLSLLAGLIFMGGLMAARFFKNRNAFILVCILSVILTYVGYVAADRVLARFQQIDAGFQTRLERSRATWEMGQDFALSGTGFGTFEFVYPGYKREKSPKVVYAHNDWAQLFAETGWPGFCVISAGFFTLLGLCIVQWRRRRDPFSISIGLGGMGALVSISVHSLSDFNLQMPANSLTLALIVAITYLSLYSYRHYGEEQYDYPRGEVKLSLWAGIALILMVALGGALIGKNVVRVWRADSLARIFWNSTIPVEDPSDEQLKRAWKMAPGNARYWAWIAGREFARPGEEKDRDIYLWSEGIKRNPTAWRIWRELGWGAFAKQRQDPDRYLPLAARALDQASRLRPSAPHGYLEAGTVALARDVLSGDKAGASAWRDPFTKALVLDPALAPKVTDQLVLYLGAQGAAEVPNLLPDDSGSHLLAARYLLREGYGAPGIDILKAAEPIKEKEIEGLLTEYRESGRWSRTKGRETLRQVLSLDPHNPEALMLKGETLKALASQEQRGDGLAGLNNLKDTVWRLRELQETNRGSPVEIAYFLARIAEAEGHLKEAEARYRKALALNPQYFPAWIRLRDILLKTARTAGDRVEAEHLGKKIALFAMDRIAPDLWRWGGTYEGLPSWKAPFRIAEPLTGLTIRFTGKETGAWRLLLDGRFVDAWAEKRRVKDISFPVPAGEHVFRLIYYGPPLPAGKKPPPCTLHVLWGQA